MKKTQRYAVEVRFSFGLSADVMYLGWRIQKLMDTANDTAQL